MSASLNQAFAAAREKNRAAFIPFVSGGFPDPVACADLIRGLDDLGAEVIEVGIPFSDPMADGPVIQASSQRALDQGMTPGRVLEMVAEVAPKLRAALVLMTYYNPVLQMGLAGFARLAASAGVAGVIVPDLPPEESGPWRRAAGDGGLDTIMMAAPTTPASRLPLILDSCRGFLYYVSLTGVTGAGLTIAPQSLERLAGIRAAAGGLPVAVGFGVARPEQAAALASAADGVIVGSALMRPLLEASSTARGLAASLSLAGAINASLERGSRPAVRDLG